MEFKTTHLMNFSNLLSRKFDSQRISSTVAVWLTVMLTVLMSTNIWAQTAPSVTTDKADYAPGETVQISGSGFLPGEKVSLLIIHIEPNFIFHLHEDMPDAQVDDDGNFTSSWFVLDEELNSTLYLTAVGQTSGLEAYTSFTDAIGLSPFTIASQVGTLTSGTAGSVTYPISIKVTGSNPAISITLSIPSLPTEVTYSPSSVSYGNGTHIFNLTLSTTANSPAGTYSFTVTVSNPDATSESARGSLLIGACTPPDTPTITALSSTTLCVGGSVELTSSASSGNQWYKDGTLISGATNQLYTATSAGSYSVIVTIGCPSNTSTATVVTLNNITGGVIAKNMTVQPGPGCGSLNPGQTVNTNSASGSGTITYNWEQSINNGGIWVTAIGEGTPPVGSFNPVNITQTTWYRRVATSTINGVICSDYSNVLEFVVNPLPTVGSITPGGTLNVCVGSTIQFANATSGGVWGTTTPLLTSVNATGLVTGLSEGAATITYTVTNEFGCSKTANRTVNVKAQPLAPSAGNINTTYGGTSKTGSATVGAGEVVDWYTTETGSISTSAPSGTNAGTYTAWAEARNTTTGCKSATRTQVTVTIGKAASVTTVTINGAPFTYTGTAITPATVSVTGAGGLSLTPPANYANNTNAGTATASYTYAESANHFGSSDSEDFAIGKAESTIVATGTISFTYSGSPQGPDGSTVTGSTGAVTFSYSGTSNGSVAYGPSATKPTLAGSYNVVATVAADDNFNGKSSEAYAFAIGKAVTTTVVTVSQPLTYNANPQGGSAVVTGAGGLNQALTVTYEGTGSTTYASSSTAPTNAGTYNIAATYAESANHFGSSDNKNFTIGTAIASVTANNKSKPYGEDNPELDATVVGQIVGGDVINYSLSTTATQTSNIGTYPITVTLGANPNYTVSAYDGTLTITQATTTTSLILSAASVRYMDMLTMTAIITPLNTATTLTGSVEFKIGSTVYGTAVAVPIPDATDGSVQATLIKQVAEMPDTYTVTATFSSTNTNYSGSSNTKQLLVRTRDASPYIATGFYTGDLFAWTTGPSTSTATLTMTAAIKDANSPTGDVRGARVTFYFVNGTTLTPIPSAQNLPVGLIDVNDGSVGTASAIVQLNIGSANAASFQIAVGITGAYTNTPGATLSQTIVTVSKPVTGGYITGGGEVANSTTSSGYIKGHSTLNTGYQFDIQYTKSGTNPKGKAQILVRSYYTKEGILDSKLHTYIITTNAIALLNVGTPPATGTFSAKANLVEQLEDLTTIAIEGGSTFQMVVFQSGCEQQIAITLYRKAGGVWFSSNWNATSAKTALKAVTTSSKVYVAGGGPCLGSSSSRTGSSEVENIQVISSTPEIQSITSEELETEAVLFKVLAYPNPSTEYFTLRLQGATHDSVQVNVFDVSGRQVFSKTGNYNDTYQFGGHFQAGVYLVRVQQGTSVENLKVIKR